MNGVILYKVSAYVSPDNRNYTGIVKNNLASSLALNTFLNGLTWTKFTYTQDCTLTTTESGNTLLGGKGCNELEISLYNKNFSASFGTVEQIFPEGQEIMRGVIYGQVASAPVVITNEAKGSSITKGTPIKTTYNNGDKTVVTSLTVYDNAVLVDAADYVVYVGNGLNGIAGQTYVTPLIDLTGPVTINYTYTPTEAFVSTEVAGVDTKNKFMLKIEGCEVNGKKHTFFLGHVYLTNDSILSFQSFNSEGTPEEKIRTYEVKGDSSGFKHEYLEV